MEQEKSECQIELISSGETTSIGLKGKPGLLFAGMCLLAGEIAKRIDVSPAQFCTAMAAALLREMDDELRAAEAESQEGE